MNCIELVALYLYMYGSPDTVKPDKCVCVGWYEILEYSSMAYVGPIMTKFLVSSQLFTTLHACIVY